MAQFFEPGRATVPRGSNRFFSYHPDPDEYWFGLGPALLSMLLGTAFGLFFFVKPYHEFTPLDATDLIGIANYVLVSSFVIALVEYLRRSLYSHQLLLKVAESRYLLLMHRDNERMYFGGSKVQRQVEKVVVRLDRAWLTVDNDGKVRVLPAFRAWVGGKIERRSLAFSRAPGRRGSGAGRDGTGSRWRDDGAGCTPAAVEARPVP